MVGERIRLEEPGQPGLALGSRDKTDTRIERGTHLLHLESQRTVLHNSVNAFLERTMR